MMEKRVRTIGYVKWLCFPLGYTMYFFTRGSFGEIISTALAVVATITFWALIRNEQTRLIGQKIAEDIKEAIQEAENKCNTVDSIIEIKKLKRGIIARVYLINAKEQASVINQAIARKMEMCTFKNYLFAMQLTDIPTESKLKETQKMLNEQLVDELIRRSRGDK